MSRPLPRGAPRAQLGLLLTLAGACCLLGCGTQGPPQPPRVEQPEKVADLAAAQVGRTLEVSFTLPRLAADHERLTKPLEIELLRGVMPSGSPTAGPPALAPWVTLQPSQWSQYAQGEKVVYPAQLTEQECKEWSGEMLALAVRTLTRGFRRRPHESELSNLVGIPVLDVSVPVEGLKTQITEKTIELVWTPPTLSLSGRPAHDVSGYRVYRSSTGSPASFNLRGETAAPRYSDGEFQFAHTYYYKVRAVTQQMGKAGESEDSLVAEVTPLDTFPPSVPAGLTAVYAADAVELVWTANSEIDLAGYNVYRREEGGTPERLNKELLATPIFRDTSAQPDHKYLYYVTALDLAKNESPPSPAVAVTTD